MIGGLGNDTYVVDSAGDSVSERNDEGTDTVRSSIDYTLRDWVENLVLLSGAVNANGNGLANSIFGNELSNVIDGGGGVDTMSGGAGDDLYFVDESGDSVVECAGQGDDEIRTALASYSPDGSASKS